jgi:hypothetical protein
MILDHQWTAKTVIYPLLCSSFGQCITITEIIDFNVLDVVTILLVCLCADGRGRVGRGRLDDWRGRRLGDVSGGTGACMCKRDSQSEWGARRHAGCPSSPESAR